MCRYEEKDFIKNNGDKLRNMKVMVQKLKEPVQFNRQSIVHNMQYTDYFFDKLSILANIEEYLKEAIYVMSEVNVKYLQKPYVKQYHYLKMKGERVNFLLEERTSGEIFFYMIKLTGDTK